MKKFKSLLVLVLAIIIAFSISISTFALTIKKTELELNGKSAILMDVATGEVLYEKEADLRLPPASVTKIMTLLLVFEAIDAGKLSLDEMLTVSENAASMGGSQIFLEPGESMSVDDLLKSVIVASANDAALTLAEQVAGSEEAFVEAMNNRATELGMKNTRFENVTGLDDDTTDHLTTARDIAIMSRELLKHEKVCEYSTIWMDTIRNGEFGLTNTNRLVRFYRGITGLKTGSTSKAGFCVSASAKRGETHLIAVIMGAESSDARNASASKLLDYGFANYSTYNGEKISIDDIVVYGGIKDKISIESEPFKGLVNKGDEGKVKYEIDLPDYVKAPLKKGDTVGKIVYTIDGEIVGEQAIICSENVPKISFWQYTCLIFKKFLLK